MTALYLLDVPEFAGFAQEAARQGFTVRAAGDYLEVTTEGPLVLERRHIGARPAIWFASLTGGFRGRLVGLDDDRLCLDEEIQ